MSALIERRAHNIGGNFVPTQPVFDLAAADADLAETLVIQVPQVREVFDAVRKRIPLPKSVAAGEEGYFYRLPGHNRSFCYSLSQSDAILDGPVVTFKGTEPLLPDFSTMIDWMAQAPLRRSARVMTDHFPLAEGKIPGALSLNEAMHEAETALDVQRRHLRHYGELARLPTPLLVHSFSAQARDACAAHLRQKLSRSAIQRIELLLQHGLAVYIYYYPAPPIRSNYLGGMVSPSIRTYLKKTFDEEVAISGWSRLLVRLLYLGYLPYSVRSEGLGACMDFGNATLDGGFCDPDSITPITEELDDEFFREGVIQSLSIMQRTIQLMLGLSQRYDIYPSIEDFVCEQYVRQLVDTALRSEGRPELRLDNRLAPLLLPRSIDDLKRCATRKHRAGSYTSFLERKARMGM